MITKCAFFQGTIKAGQEAAMRAYVEAELAPLWCRFQPSEDIKILFNVENDKNGPTIPLALIVTYKDQASLDQACLLYTSPSPRDRQKSRMPSSA